MPWHAWSTSIRPPPGILSINFRTPRSASVGNGVRRFCGGEMARLTTLRPSVAALSSRLRLPPKIADPFYQSAEWRALVARVKRERGSWCQRCGSKQRVIADHIVERRDGGADLDASNIEILCFKHHQQKTALAQRRRALGA